MAQTIQGVDESISTPVGSSRTFIVREVRLAREGKS